MLAEWLGGRAVVGVSMGLSGILTAITPYSASLGFYSIYGVRLLTGVLAVSSLHQALAITNQSRALI